MTGMGRAGNTSDFYEDDEPVADVVAAFARGTKRRTAPRGTLDESVSARGSVKIVSRFGNTFPSNLSNGPAVSPHRASYRPATPHLPRHVPAR